MSISFRARANAGFALGAVAVFISLGGPAWAANTIGSIDIIDNAIQSIDIGDGQVATADLALNAVTSGRILDGQVASPDIADGNVGSADLQNGGVQSIDLFDGAVTAADILNGTVSLADLGANSVNSANVVDNSLGRADIASDAIAFEELARDAVDSVHMRAGSVRSDELEEGVVERKFFDGFAPSGLTQRGGDEISSYLPGMPDEARISEYVRFPIPLSSAPVRHVMDMDLPEQDPPPQCPGSNVQPEALPGHLCIWVNSYGGWAFSETRSGFFFDARSDVGTFRAGVSWAVTAP